MPEKDQEYYKRKLEEVIEGIVARVVQSRFLQLNVDTYLEEISPEVWEELIDAMTWCNCELDCEMTTRKGYNILASDKLFVRTYLIQEVGSRWRKKRMLSTVGGHA